MRNTVHAARLFAAVATLALAGSVAAAPAPAATAPTPTTTTTTVPADGYAPAPTPDGPRPEAAPPPHFPVPAKVPADAPVPPPLFWLTSAKTRGGWVRGSHGTLVEIAKARVRLARARRTEHAANARVAGVVAQLTASRSTLASLVARQHEVAARARTRAIDVYISGSGNHLLDELGVLVAPPSTSDDAGARVQYADIAQSVDSQTVDDVTRRVNDMRTHIAGLERDEDAARHSAATAHAATRAAAAMVSLMTSVVADPARGGRIFPVEGKFDFGDSWGAYRASVTSWGSHGHDATDIMAAKGTPIVAVETGVLDRVGWNRLGGWRLWIKGVSGTNYYYAHMSAYAPKLKNGMRVVAGQYLGRVGNTGNAQGGPTHLHFEVHLPPFDVVVNPYPLLCLLAGAPIPVIPPSEPLVPPTTTTTTTTPTTTPTSTTAAPSPTTIPPRP